MKKSAPYGSWSSPITPDMVAGKSPRLNDVRLHNNCIFWSESIAEEKGRNAIMMHDGKQLQCVLPRPLSAKSKVHEYGGAAYTLHDTTLFFVLADDQRIYSVDLSSEPFEPKPLTPENTTYRYADLEVDSKRQNLIAVREEHTESGEVINSLVSVPFAGTESIQVLTEGHDFYSNPRISPCGEYLSWLTWDHPNMPWDTTELWLAQLEPETLTSPQKVAGNGKESIFQPQWSPKGDLCFVSDRNNWWNIYCLPNQNIFQNEAIALCTMEAEFATPQWVFGMSTYGFLNDDTIFAIYTQDGIWAALEIHFDEQYKSQTTNVSCECSSLQSVSCADGKASFIGASPTLNNAVYLYDGKDIQALTPLSHLVDPEQLSLPQAIAFPTTDGDSAKALFYPPKNTSFTCEEGLPPLIVLGHGGPTGATESALNFKIQFWTNRGFAVADVNYRGSTGYGRQYRQRLNEKWGVYDVDDVCEVVAYLSKQNLIDKDRCVIKGSSAGGYTTLAALAFRDVFSAGVSIYGIGDLIMLAEDTHKFEARYLDSMIGPYPEQEDEYKARSPINAIDKIDCPLLIFQGMQDMVVPPNQADAMFNLVKNKGLPCALVTYEDEGHGFRNADTIKHTLDSEWQFYAKLFKFKLPDPPAFTLEIENLENV